MSVKVKAFRAKGGKVKAHRRRKKGGGSVMVKASSRNPYAVQTHLQAARGRGRKVMNSVGRRTYSSNPD